jgi:hypothetical protein
MYNIVTIPLGVESLREKWAQLFPYATFQPKHQATFGGLVDSMLASDIQVRGFKRGRSRRIFRGENILNMPSFGGKVKQSVPCGRFAAC